MKLTELSVRRPVLVTVVFLAFAALGVLAFKWIPIDLFPEVEIPSVSVVTLYTGAGASDVEEKVSKRLEESLGSLAHLKEMISASKENMSIVTLRFDYGTDMDEAMADIRQALDFAQAMLPEDVEDPILFKFDMSMMPVLMLAAVMEKGDVRYYRDYFEDNVAEPLKRVDGVGSVSIMGAQEFVVYVEADSGKLTSFGLTLEDLKGAIAAQNVSLPIGKVDEGKMDLTLRMPAQFGSISQLEEAILSNRGTIVRLKDVATVRLDLKDSTEVTEMNGRTALAIMVMKMSGANTVAVAENAKARLAEIESSLPPGAKLETVFDTSAFIQHSIDNLTTTLIWSVLLVTAVVFLFLWRLTSSLVILVAIPASLIIAFFGIYIAGYTLNVISLMSMTIAVGMVVDNAIVVLENITRHVDWDVPPEKAAVEGGREVGLAISASTLTTVVVFLPLVFVSGFIAILFGNLAYVLSITILSSLFVALTLTPMMCAKYLRKPPPGRKVFFAADRALKAFEAGFGRMIAGCLRHRAAVLLAALAILVSSGYLVTRVGFDFMPPSNSGEIQATLELPVGTRLEESARVARELTVALRANPAVKFSFFRAGTEELGFDAAMGSKEGANIITVFLMLKPMSERTITDLEFCDFLRRETARFPEVKRLTVVSGSGLQAMLTGGDKPFTLEVRGDDLDQMAKAALDVEAIIRQIPGTEDVAAELSDMRPELAYRPDRERALAEGLVPAQLGNTLRTALHGQVVSKFRGLGRDDEIRLRLRAEDRLSAESLGRVRVRSFTGRLVALEDIGRFVEGYAPVDIIRKDKQRTIKVGAILKDRAMGDVADEAEIALRKAGLYARSGISVFTTGMVKEQREIFESLGLLLILAVVLVFLVMAGQFESYLDPFVILFSIPFAFTGAFSLLWVTGTHLSVPAALGLVILVGVVVNNAIVFVDYANLMRREQGMGLTQALEVAAERRLRPVLMTSLTTVAGLVPMATSAGEGSEFWAPLGRAALGGMLLSTFVTLIIVPVLYHLLNFARKNPPAPTT
jgi:HAE1 family hydrophobic/amphiphilic exporter-1